MPSPESGLRMLPDHARPQLPADAHGNGHDTRQQEHDETGKQQIELVLVTHPSGPMNRQLILTEGGDGMQIRLTRDLEAERRAVPGPMSVDAFLARFPEVPRDVRDEPVMAEFVRAFGAQLEVAQKPSPCVARAGGGDAEHHFYTRLGNDLAIYGVGLVQFVPTIALTLVVGQVADRCDRRLVVVVCHATEAGATAALALGSLGGWLGRDGILGMVAILGAARAFENPSRAALVPRLVPFALIPRAIASVTSAGQTARIVGPALGGVLYGLGPTAVYATVAALYLL